MVGWGTQFKLQRYSNCIVPSQEPVLPETVCEDWKARATERLS